MANRIWSEETLVGSETVPLVACAIHDGHAVRHEVADLLVLDAAGRLREEDPFTGEWTRVAPTRFVGLASRFQVDLNRPRETAVYRRPEDAWGLHVWKHEIPDEVAQRSLQEYDAFYDALESTFKAMTQRFGRFVVYDLHSYNHRRVGPAGAPANPETDPQVNIGTGTLNRSTWAPVIDRFIGDLRACDFPGGNLDVRENVKFRGGNLARWAHTKFPDTVCVLAIEFKKFFMDEWTGIPERSIVDAIGGALLETVPGVVEELKRL